MVIEVTYNVTDVYMSTTVSPIYITVDYSGTGGGGSSVWGAITGTLSNQTDLQTALDGKFDDPTGTSLQYIDGTGAVQTFPLTLPVLQEVRNQTGSTLDAGTVVYINGATGNKPTVTKAIATGDSTSAQTLGMVSAAISNNSTGYVVVIGTCSGLDTSAFTEGQQLYLSGTTAGGVTTTKPYAPIHLVYVGIVTRSHPTLGTIEVRVQNGYELDEIHDVDALNPSNNDGIFYNSGNSLWEHKPISTVLGYTPEQPLTFSSPLSRSTNTVSIPVASSSANGYLSSTDWSTFNSKGSGTVTSVSALTLGTTGTDVSSTVANGTTTPVITLNIPTASATNRGALSSTDWSTFNSKQGALTLTTTGTSGAATLVGSTLNIPQYSGGGGMAIGGSITSATAGSVLFAGTSGVLAQDNSNFFWDNTNKRLGIGTTSPQMPLHIYGVVPGLYVDAFVHNGSTNTSDGTQARIRLVVGTNTANGNGVTFGVTPTGSPAYSGNAYFWNEKNSSFMFATNNSEKMRLWANGNLTLTTGTHTDSGERLQVTGTAKITSTLTTSQYRLSALNTAPTSASDTGTLGEIRIDASYIYICTATNTWKRVAIATW